MTAGFFHRSWALTAGRGFLSRRGLGKRGVFKATPHRRKDDGAHRRVRRATSLDRAVFGLGALRRVRACSGEKAAASVGPLTRKPPPCLVRENPEPRAMKLLPCPELGDRPISEFVYGGRGPERGRAADCTDAGVGRSRVFIANGRAGPSKGVVVSPGERELVLGGARHGDGRRGNGPDRRHRAGRGSRERRRPGRVCRASANAFEWIDRGTTDHPSIQRRRRARAARRFDRQCALGQRAPCLRAQPAEAPSAGNRRGAC